MIPLPEPTDGDKNKERVWGGRKYESWDYNPINPNTLTYTKNLNTEICKKDYIRLDLNKMLEIGVRLPGSIKKIMIEALGYIPRHVKHTELDLATLRTIFAYRCVQCATFGEVYLHQKERLDIPVIKVFLHLGVPYQTCGNFMRFEPKSKPVQYLYADMTPDYKTKVLTYFSKLLAIVDFSYCSTKSYTPHLVSKVYNI